MARSTNALQAEAGYIDARPHQPGRGSLLHRTAGPYIRVKMRRTRSEHIWSALGPNSRPFSGHRFAPLRAKTRLSWRSRRHNPDKWFRLQPCHLVVRGDAAPYAASPPISEMLRPPDFEFRAERSVLILPWRADQRKFVTTSLDGPNGDLPKFASNSRTNGTADENKAVVQGSISHFGHIS